MSNLKPNTNELAQVVVDKLNHIPDVKKKVISQKDQDLIDTLKSIANDIEKDNIVEPECIRFAAKRLEELT